MVLSGLRHARGCLPHLELTQAPDPRRKNFHARRVTRLPNLTLSKQQQRYKLTGDSKCADKAQYASLDRCTEIHINTRLIDVGPSVRRDFTDTPRACSNCTETSVSERTKLGSLPGLTIVELLNKDV